METDGWVIDPVLYVTCVDRAAARLGLAGFAGAYYVLKARVMHVPFCIFLSSLVLSRKQSRK